MHIAAFILIAIGIWGVLFPEALLEAGSGGGRWVFVLIVFLGASVAWRTIRRRKP